VPDTVEILKCDTLLMRTTPLTLSIPRFAVGSFDSWLQFRGSLDDLGHRGFAFENFNWLAQQRVLAGKTVVTPSQIPVSLEELAFPAGAVCCTAGVLYDRLRGRLDEGARSLKEAFCYWLIPRHAAQFQAAIEDGKIQLWIRLIDAEDERRAYQSLLANSSNSVGVHDLAPPPQGAR
jgi:hypothetical protein